MGARMAGLDRFAYMFNGRIHDFSRCAHTIAQKGGDCHVQSNQPELTGVFSQDAAMLTGRCGWRTASTSLGETCSSAGAKVGCISSMGSPRTK